MSLWLKNNKLVVDSLNRPIDCSTCPCVPPVPVECSEAVDAEIQAYLDIIDPDTQQHVWSLYGTYEANYTCAEWSYDTELQEWTLIRPASGYLLVALRKGQIVTDTTGCLAEKLVYAKTIYNVTTGEYKTIGCQCRISDHECKHRKTVLSDYLIAGELHVKPYAESDSGASYAPSDACEVDPCELLKLKLDAAHYWHGGQLMSEGYYDWLTASHVWQSDNYNYQPFLMAIKWEVEMSYSDSESHDPIYNLTFINCDCTSITTHTLQAGETCLEYAGICTLEDPCINLMLLHNKAEENGWLWHGEGVLAHLAKVTVNDVTTYGSWYALREQSWNYGYSEYVAYVKRMCCAETADGYWVINCECGSAGFYAKDSPVEAYWKYFDLDGVCACPWEDGHYPDRELLLTYPEDFGLMEVVWGNDNKFEYEFDTEEYNPDEGAYTVHHEGCNVCGYHYEPNQGYGGRTMYIDYRAMCFTGLSFQSDGSQGVWVRVIYPHGSQGAPYYNGYRRYFAIPANNFSYPYGIYDIATFTGTHFTPFAHDSEIYSETDGTRYLDGLDFKGFGYTWNAGGWYADMYINMCNPTETCDYNIQSESEARSEAGCDMTAPTPCITVNDKNDVHWDKPALLTPDFTVVTHDCQVRRVVPDPEDPYWYYYCYLHKWWEIGASIGQCAWSMLNVHYVETNLGFIIKGMDGYRESYVLIGVSNYPEYAWCWDEDAKNPEQEPWSGEYNDPYHWLDKTITCPADEDMHFCVGGFDIPDDSDSDESESTSDESTSISDTEESI